MANNNVKRTLDEQGKKEIIALAKAKAAKSKLYDQYTKARDMALTLRSKIIETFEK